MELADLQKFVLPDQTPEHYTLFLNDSVTWRFLRVMTSTATEVLGAAAAGHVSR